MNHLLVRAVDSSVFVQLTCEDAVNASYHQLCVLHTETHRGFELHDVFPGAICTHADVILLF